MTQSRHSREPAPAESIPFAPAIVAWIERALGTGARVVRGVNLPPSSTIQHRIEVALPDGSARSVLLRRYHDAARLLDDPWYVPAHEALALRLLSGTAVPAPHLYAADLDAAVCGTPALLESWLPGRPTWRPHDLDGYMARTAEVLKAIHAVTVPPRAALRPYAPYHDRETITRLLSARGALWKGVASVLAAPRPASRDCFIHRDYHPGNVLYDGAVVTGVVDWTTAAWGPPGIDLARMRLNLAIHLGCDAADRFLDAYTGAGGDPAARAPYWDLLDAADLLPDFAPGAGDLERLEEYVAMVLAECGGRAA